MNVPIVMMVKSIQYSSTVILNEEKSKTIKKQA